MNTNDERRDQAPPRGHEAEEEHRLASVAAAERVEPALLQAGMEAGTVVVPWARGNDLARPMAVGRGLRVKVNANIGTSPDCADLERELRKLRVAVEAGADAVMDLSTGGDLRAVRAAVRAACPVPLGTVPIYEAGCIASRRGEPPESLGAADLLEAVRRHVADGVDFVTVHCGITKRAVEFLRAHPRVCGVVSRGGALLARWIVANGEENPLYAHFDEVIDICRERDVALSLGDALRPGALADAGDRAQMDELYTLGELARRARARGVQVIIEGPGHVPADQIAAQVKLEKVACDNAPFYVLGPLVTDVAPGYDHISCAIGGAMAAMAGADFLCYVTPAEHLRLPEADDVRVGVMAARIAAHAADVARGLPGARDWDDRMSRARKERDWEEMLRLAIDPELARASRERVPPRAGDVCSMCGEFCALRGEGFL